MMVLASKPGGYGNFLTRPGGLCPHNHLYEENQISLPGINRPGDAVNRALYCSADIKERFEL